MQVIIYIIYFFYMAMLSIVMDHIATIKDLNILITNKVLTIIKLIVKHGRKQNEETIIRAT